MSDEDDLHVAIMRRARGLNRAITIVVIATAVVGTALFAAAFYESFSVRGRGGAVVGGVLASVFFVTLTSGWFVGRRLLVARLRDWVGEAERGRGVERGSLDYIVSMYAKEDDGVRSRPGSSRDREGASRRRRR
jgi:hypothetical protein